MSSGAATTLFILGLFLLSRIINEFKTGKPKPLTVILWVIFLIPLWLFTGLFLAKQAIIIFQQMSK